MCLYFATTQNNLEVSIAKVKKSDLKKKIFELGEYKSFSFLSDKATNFIEKPFARELLAQKI